MSAYDAISDIALDRLVDGTLNETERADLLARLDASPDGWRRCALAFLEAQAWHDAFSPEPSRTVGLPPVPPARRRPDPRVFAVAASIALAFALGWGVGRVPAQAQPPRDSVADATQGPPSAPVPAPTVPSVPKPTAPQAVSGYSFVTINRPDYRETVTYRLRPNEPGVSVSDYARAQWLRQGFEVVESRRVVPVVLENGQSTTVPVQQLVFDYVGNRPL